jgi:hypothetical protein
MVHGENLKGDNIFNLLQQKGPFMHQIGDEASFYYQP